MRIQEYLTAAIRNVQILMKFRTDPRKAISVSKLNEKIREKLSGLTENSERFLLKFIFRVKGEIKVDFVFSDR